MSLQVGRIWKNQIGESAGFRLEGIADNEKRDLVFTLLVFVVQHFAHFAGVHAGIPRHVRHEDQ